MSKRYSVAEFNKNPLSLQKGGVAAPLAQYIG